MEENMGVLSSKYLVLKEYAKIAAVIQERCEEEHERKLQNSKLKKITLLRIFRTETWLCKCRPGRLFRVNSSVGQIILVPLCLDVDVFDTLRTQYAIPELIITRPFGGKEHTPDLIFNYSASTFAFRIARRAKPEGAPLFDTLPLTLIPLVVEEDNSTALNGFPLVFEDQYLQLTSALPLDASVYGLGDIIASSGFRRDTKGNNTNDVDARYGTHLFYLKHRMGNESSSHGVLLLSTAGEGILLVIPQDSPYSDLVGRPLWQPVRAAAFGFHLCKYAHTGGIQVRRIREANIPLEVMWYGIDLYHAVHDFTTDRVTYPVEVRSFIGELFTFPIFHYRHPVVDSSIAKKVNESDVYLPCASGLAQISRGVFIAKPDGPEYVGQIFPNWFQNNTRQWWMQALRNWSWRESVSGPNGNIIVNGTLTFMPTISRRKVDVNTPPYAIHNIEMDIHNLQGLMRKIATYQALKNILPGKRPFIIHRFTFASSGKWTVNFMYHSIQRIFQFQLFQVPFVGADACVFNWGVTSASRTAIATHYSLLPYWFTLFTNASLYGTSPRNWYNDEVVNATSGGNASLSAPPRHVNVRDGEAILFRAELAYTLKETRQGPYLLLVSLSKEGFASGSTYFDDSASAPLTPSATLGLVITLIGDFNVSQRLRSVTVLDVGARPSTVTLDGRALFGVF
ncbi:glycosyl hydrolases family 31-domain-containing protein [Desarmillaria tabescens]|uniref:Glycosyl hydrolases family 31-domain-containing protein n=1 Tax=Armillaria tabescens TaxID=1929756 RepID=A0AA39KC48_ARMTA|nr:glycosyl hydrolases family 31-domain-containing protein [Desarmillaria tabescens]KAK0458262.1 glycosyl hydrolases family 31-domain-containing protein [Desarmillaria tabescens]